MTGAVHPTHWNPYCGPAPLPAELLTRWNVDPMLLGALVLVVIGWRWRCRGQASPRRDRLALAALGLTLLLFVSPFCALTSALFSARVVHHVALTAVLAPLLVLALPRSESSRPPRLALWTATHVLAFWAWHSPAIYAAALASDAIYWTMQLSLVGTAFLFWRSIRHSSAPAAVAALLAMMVQMGLLGALITFAGRALYAPHLDTTAPWGLSALADQQLAGLVMWAPSAAFYLAAALLIASRWLRAEDLSDARPA